MPRDKMLDLPFRAEYTEGNNVVPPCHIVWTTFQGDDTVDHVCVVDIHGDDPHGKRAEAIAAFVSDALNAYVSTPNGIKAWRKIHPLLPIASGIPDTTRKGSA